MKFPKFTPILFALLISISAPLFSNDAFASSKPKEGTMSNPLTVEIPGIVVPIVNGKRLVNYCFMTIVVHGADDKSATNIRNNQFLVKDAISRATSKSPIPVLPQASIFDANTFVRTVMPAIAQAFPGTRINKIEVQNAQMMKR
ncbi:MAG: hypothetical protein J0L55_07820 [Caulobacterales bacterium]|nr:hypothetical protein [Caulobacterales bacterium]MCA0372992.1 hypothetical protein [Pseudomonadota bacterium]